MVAFYFLNLSSETPSKNSEIKSKSNILNNIFSNVFNYLIGDSPYKSFDYIDNDSDKLLPTICYSSIHHLPLLKIIPFILDSYEKPPKLNDTSFSDLFFQEDLNDTNTTLYTITDIKDLTNPENKNDTELRMYFYKVHLELFNIDIVILSIKGTSYEKDFFIDAQLFLPTALLTLINKFSVFSSKTDSHSYKMMRFILTFPFYIFVDYTVIDESIRKLIDVYDKNDLDKYGNYLMFVGHSLGGGLAKIMGKIKNKQAISLSGPGVTAFVDYWKDEMQGTAKNFELTEIDIIPDMDLVPRVEVSGGTVYRLPCEAGAFSCHSSKRSLCTAMIMCRDDYRKFYCTNKKYAGLSEDDYERMERITDTDTGKE